MSVGEQVASYIQESRSYYKHRYGTSRLPFPRELADLGEPTVQSLRVFLHDTDVASRWVAVYALGEIGLPALASLVEALQDENPEIRMQAIQALGTLGRPALGSLTNTLSDTDEGVRKRTVQALARIGEPAAGALTHALDDPSEEVRTQVVYSLAEAGEWALSLHVLALEDVWWWQSMEWLVDLASTKPSTVAKAVIDQLVVRRSGRPDERFNSKVVVHSLQGIIQHNPETAGRIRARLCDLAYAHTGAVRQRAVAVASELGADAFVATVKSRQKKNASAAAAIVEMLGKSQSAAAFSEQEREALGRLKELRALLTQLETLSQERWHELIRQARWSFYINRGLSAGFFLLGTGITVWRVMLVSRSADVWLPLAGGLLALVAAVVLSLGVRFWQSPTERIQNFSARQAQLHVAFLGFISRVAQVRLVFENHCAAGELTLGDLERYQKVLKDAIAQASLLLSDEGPSE